MSQPKQLDVFDHSAAKLAAANRIAAATSRAQFPHDHRRAAFYESEADRLERIANESARMTSAERNERNR